MTDWIILRTSAQSTLRLVETLTDAGFEAWTPIEAVKEGDKDKPQAMIATFVFARAHHLADILDLLRSPSLNYLRWDTDLKRMVVKGHPSFSVFRYLGQYPTVRDAALNALRLCERRRKPRGLVKSYVVGDRVRIFDGAFEGLRGVVVAIVGKKAEVEFPGQSYARSAKFPMHVLLDDESVVHIHGSQSEQAPHAKAA